MWDGKYIFRLSSAAWLILICAAAKFTIRPALAGAVAFVFVCLLAKEFSQKAGTCYEKNECGFSSKSFTI